MPADESDSIPIKDRFWNVLEICFVLSNYICVGKSIFVSLSKYLCVGKNIIVFWVNVFLLEKVYLFFCVNLFSAITWRWLQESRKSSASTKPDNIYREGKQSRGWRSRQNYSVCFDTDGFAASLACYRGHGILRVNGCHGNSGRGWFRLWSSGIIQGGHLLVGVVVSINTSKFITL